MIWGLPVTVEIGGTEYGIRTDYRAILDICAAISDPDLDNQEKSIAALSVFYPDIDGMPPEHYEDALRECFRFINCDGEEAPRRAPRLVDWEQDYSLIIAPINRVLGCEARAVEYMHWWTFLAAYQEIGDCTFAQVVRIRDKLARGKSLDKQDREWYRRNRNLVDLKAPYTSAEKDLLKEWSGR